MIKLGTGTLHPRFLRRTPAPREISAAERDRRKRVKDLKHEIKVWTERMRRPPHREGAITDLNHRQQAHDRIERLKAELAKLEAEA